MSSDNPCRVKKNTNNFFIGNFTIVTQLCDFFVVFLCFVYPRPVASMLNVDSVHGISIYECPSHFANVYFQL